MTEQRPPTELQNLMKRLLAGVSQADLKKMQTQYDELESRVTAEELKRMETLLRKAVTVTRIRKAVKG